MRADTPEFSGWTNLARAVAATLVVISHARDVLMTDYPGQKLWAPFYALTGLGHSAVEVFFVLSGFWISRSVLRRIDDPSFWPSYLINRMSRLGIVLVPTLMLGGLLDVIGINLLNRPIYQGLPGSHGLIQNVAENLSWLNFFGNLAFLQTIFVNPFGSNEPLWSLAYELWYYIWFPALVLMIRQRRLSFALVTLAIGFKLPALYLGFLSWLVGWALLQLLDAAPEKPVARGWVWVMAGFFAIMLWATARSGQVLGDAALAVSFGALLLATGRSALPFPRWLRPLASYGHDTSFSLYAIHFPVVMLLGGLVVGRERLAPSGRSLFMVLALTAICLAVGRAFSQRTEAFTKQLRDWLQRRLPQRA